MKSLVCFYILNVVYNALKAAPEMLLVLVTLKVFLFTFTLRRDSYYPERIPLSERLHPGILKHVI